MKKYLFSLLVLPFLFWLTSARNCTTLNSRYEAFIQKQEDYIYRSQILVNNKPSNEYQASLWFEDYYKLEAEEKKLDAEGKVLQEEDEWCKDLRDEYNWYIKKWDDALKKLLNIDKYDSYYAHEVLKYYQKAYDMIDYNFTDPNTKRAALKEQIDPLKEMINTEEQKIADEKRAKQEAEAKAKEEAKKKAQEEKEAKAKEEAQAKEQTNSFINESKEYLWSTADTLDWILTELKKKPKKTQDNIFNIAESFMSSKDKRTHHIGQYIRYNMKSVWEY